MKDDIEFLKESELFKGLPESLLRRVVNEGRVTEYSANEYIFREGDEEFNVYVIKKGVVEIQKIDPTSKTLTVVAYLSNGECFGEMALITGRPRSASARVPQSAEVLEIPAEVYESVILENRLFLRRLCELLAYRLESANIQIAAITGKELQGDLHYFDIATVMQTLINSGQSGIMIIESRDGVRAEVIFRKGQVIFARMGALVGEEAFFQIFQQELEGQFQFKGENVEDETIPAPIEKNPMNLLLEAMRMKDELAVYVSKIKDFDRVFTPIVKTLVWEDQSTLETALMVWMKIVEGESLKNILSMVPRCSYSILSVIDNMLEKGFIK